MSWVDLILINCFANYDRKTAKRLIKLPYMLNKCHIGLHSSSFSSRERRHSEEDPALIKGRIRPKIYWIACKICFPTHFCHHSVLTVYFYSNLVKNANTFLHFIATQAPF